MDKEAIYINKRFTEEQRKIFEELNKKYTFFIDKDDHARLLIQLKYDKLKQTKFFRLIVKGYIENNKHIRDFLDEAFTEQISARIKRNRKNDRKEEEKIAKDFLLDDTEVENIFDILESENTDI